MSKGYIDLDTGKYIDNNKTSLSTGKMNHNARGGEPTDINLVKLDPAAAYMQLLNSAVRHMELDRVRAVSDLLNDMNTVGVKNIDVANEKYNPLRPNATYREINPDKAGKYRDNNVSAKLDDEDISI